jgi:hypothetical protein
LGWEGKEAGSSLPAAQFHEEGMPWSEAMRASHIRLTVESTNTQEFRIVVTLLVMTTAGRIGSGHESAIDVGVRVEAEGQEGAVRVRKTGSWNYYLVQL